MKATTRVITLSVLGAVFIAGVIALALWLADGPGGPAHAQPPPPPITVGFDMDTTGNTCPGEAGTPPAPEDYATGECGAAPYTGNGVDDDSDTVVDDGCNCTLGTIDNCVEVPTGGGPITFDVFLKDLPPAPEGENGFVTFSFVTGEKNGQTVGTVTAYSHKDPLVNLIFQALPQDANIFDSSDPVGTFLPPWKAAPVDLFGGVEKNPPYTQGVLSRVTADTTGTGDGVYYLTIAPPGETGGLIVGDELAQDYCDINSSVYVGCNILDGNSPLPGYGLVAIGQACPETMDVFIVSQDVLAANCTDPPPTTMAINTPTDVCVHKVLRQDDVTTVDVDITLGHMPAPDCASTRIGGPDTATLPESTDVTVDEIFRVWCLEPSTHGFTFDNEIQPVAGPEWDPNQANNTATDSLSLDVTAEADLAVTGVTVNAPAQAAVQSTFPVSATVSVANTTVGGPLVNANVTSTLDFTNAPDCSTLDTNPQVTPVAGLGISSVTPSWNVTCTSLGLKTFNVIATITLVPTTHVSDPNAGNNELTDTGDTNITPAADVAIISQALRAGNCTDPPPAQLAAGVDTSFCLHKTIVNNGPTTPVDVDVDLDAFVLPGDCTFTGGAPHIVLGVGAIPVVVDELFTLNCTQPSLHSFTFSNQAFPTGGVSDPFTINNVWDTFYNDIPVLAETDVQITQAFVSPPAEIIASDDTVVTLQMTLHNLGAYGPVNVSITAGVPSTPANCTATFVSADPFGPLPVSVDVVVDEDWIIHCNGEATGVIFMFDNSIAITTAHVSDPIPINNEATTGLMVNVISRLGDVDCDDVLDIADAVMILEYILGRANLTNQCPPPPGDLYGPAADAYDDGVDIIDAVLVLQCILGRNNIMCPP